MALQDRGHHRHSSGGTRNRGRRALVRAAAPSRTVSPLTTSLSFDLVIASSSLLKNSDQNAIRETIESGAVLTLSCVFGSVLESMLLADPSKNLFQQTASLLFAAVMSL